MFEQYIVRVTDACDRTIYRSKTPIFAASYAQALRRAAEIAASIPRAADYDLIKI